MQVNKFYGIRIKKWSNNWTISDIPWNLIIDKGSRDALNFTKHETWVSRKEDKIFIRCNNHQNRPLSGPRLSSPFRQIFSPTCDTEKLLKSFVVPRHLWRLLSRRSLRARSSGGPCREKAETGKHRGWGDERERERNKDYQSGWRRYGKELNRISLCPLDSFALPITPPFWNLGGISLLWFGK